MFIVSIDKNNVKMAEKEMVTSGSVNAYGCQFVFSDEWDKMTKTVTFKAGEKTISVTLDEENKCVIPWEVLAVADVDLYVGVIGAAGAETEDPTDDVVIPTVWGHMGTVRHGTTEGENTEIPTPSAYERIMIEINTIKNDIKDINNTFNGGEVGQVWTKTEYGEGWEDGGAASAPSIGDNGNWYIGDTDTGVKAAGTDGINGEDGQDGFSPTVDVTTIEGGHTVTITDKDGAKSFDVMNGTDGNDGATGATGADGFSPTVAIAEIEGGHTVTITDATGSHSANIMNGKDGNDGSAGADGADGFSPTVAIAEIEGGHTVTITDATGSHSANIMNGKDGNDGSAGADGADGFSPIVEVTEIEGGHTVTITDKDGAKSFDVTNGANGADGIDGSNGADGKDGADGFSPIVAVENIDNGHKVTITDKDGAKSFDVMNGADGSAGANGADGKAATIRIGTVTEGDTPAVTNSGTDTDAVFDFVLPGASGGAGGAEYSMVKASSVANTINTAEYNLTKDGSTIGSAIEIPKSMRDICMGKVTPTHLASGVPSSISWVGPFNATLSLKSSSTAAMKVAALYSSDVLGSSLVGCDYALPRYIDFKVNYANTTDTADYNLAYITIKYESTIYISDAYGQNVYVSGFNGDTPIKMGFISVNRSSNMAIKVNGAETNSVPCYCLLGASTTTWDASIYPIGKVTISNPSGATSGSFRVTLAM